MERKRQKKLRILVEYSVPCILVEYTGNWCRGWINGNCRLVTCYMYIPPFWTSGDITRFQSLSKPERVSLICTWQRHTCYKFSKIHLWYKTCWRPLGGKKISSIWIHLWPCIPRAQNLHLSYHRQLYWHCFATMARNTSNLKSHSNNIPNLNSNYYLAYPMNYVYIWVHPSA